MQRQILHIDKNTFHSNIDLFIIIFCRTINFYTEYLFCKVGDTKLRSRGHLYRKVPYYTLIEYSCNSFYIYFDVE